MVKLENGVTSSGDDGDYQELLSPPQPSSPSGSISSRLAATTAPGRVVNGCRHDDRVDDVEQEPLLHGSSSKKKEESKADGCQLQHNGDLTVPIYVTSDRLSVGTGKQQRREQNLSQILRFPFFREILESTKKWFFVV
jgi:hypothetical protein